MRLIDADALKERLLVLRGNITNVQCISDIFDICLTEVSNAQTIPQTIVTEFKGCDNCELERPRGEWNYIQSDMCICPFCGAYPHKDYKNFCPNCGADMRGVK